ncbi:Ca2+-dependent phosphoinositide-specific phospholipase C [Streptomyces werraensis]|uniref:Ca2+-dependent phosphoinositide-specific phospholipase C n=1 Tax=Streptomyces werraensis TaxID=68284 RepID=UPI001CE276E9
MRHLEARDDQARSRGVQARCTGVLFQTVEHEIRSVFGARHLITPDDVRRPGLTLEQSVLKHGGPTVARPAGMSARYDRDFFISLPGPAAARCNPVSASKHCRDASPEH